MRGFSQTGLDKSPFFYTVIYRKNDAYLEELISLLSKEIHKS